MRLVLAAVAVALLPACVAIHGPCTVDRQDGRAWCQASGFMVLVPGSAILDVRRGTLEQNNPGQEVSEQAQP